MRAVSVPQKHLKGSGMVWRGFSLPATRPKNTIRQLDVPVLSEDPQRKTWKRAPCQQRWARSFSSAGTPTREIDIIQRKIRQCEERIEEVAQNKANSAAVEDALFYKREEDQLKAEKEQLKNEMNALKLPARHLVLAVHGVGEAFFSEVDIVRSWEDKIAGFARLCAAVDRKSGKTEHESTVMLEPNARTPEKHEGICASKIELIPIEWHQAVHGIKSGVDPRLRRITLPTVPVMRDIANNIVADVIFYTSGYDCSVLYFKFHARVSNQTHAVCCSSPHGSMEPFVGV
eukprot:271818-Rhodomonas_salina.1